MLHRKLGLSVPLFFLLIQYPHAALAHWCDDLWESAYNIVVRPASDTVNVPAGGSATVEIFVQNNMGYALPAFELVADLGGTVVPAKRESQKVADTLFPGEKAKYTLTISKSGGGQVAMEQINFSVRFGESSGGQWGANQWGMYPTPAQAKATVIKKVSGGLSPAAPVSPRPAATRGQSKQMELAAVTDFIDLNAGLDGLLQLYCAGRGSWNSNSVANITTWCPNTSTTKCQTRPLSATAGTKFDYPKLWAAMELAVRKGSLGCPRMTVLRERLKCGVADPNLGFAGFAMMMLGYLGEDPGARQFLQEKINAGGDVGTIAKAALLLFGNRADSTTYLADVQAGTKHQNLFVSGACAASLGIVNRDDAVINSVLLPRAQWIEPDTSDNGQAMYAAHLIALVAWDRRGYAPNADDKGSVTFFEGGTPQAFNPGPSCPGDPIPTGGAPATGGTTAVMGGAVATGGVPSAGGVTATGGVPSQGGAVRTGGIASTGGIPNLGGIVARGGAVAQGGAVALGGQPARGGGTPGTGGASVVGFGGMITIPGGAGGSTGIPSTDPAAPTKASSSGCRFSTSPHSQKGWPIAFVFLGWMLFARRRGR